MDGTNMPGIWKHILRDLQWSNDPKLQQEALLLKLNSKGPAKFASWDSLVENLVKVEPVQEENSCLVFKPRFDQLSQHTRTLLLALILQHWQQISGHLLAKFRDNLSQHSKFAAGEACPHTWETFAVTQLATCLEVKKSLGSGCDASQEQAPCYTFSSCNSAMKDNIVKTLLATSDVGGSAANVSKLNPWADTVTSADEGIPPREPVARGGRLLSMEPVRLERDDSGGNTPTEASQPMESEEQPAKRAKLDTTCESGTSQEASDDVGNDAQDRLTRLKERWHQADDAIHADDVTVLATCNVTQVAGACRLLEVDELSEAGLVLASRDVISLHAQLPHTVAVSLTSRLLGVQLSRPHQRFSRVIVQSYTAVAARFPQALIEGVLLPKLTDNRLDAAQIDLLIQIIKSGLATNHLNNLLSLYAGASPTITEEAIPILHFFVDSKLVLEEIVLSNLISVLEVNADGFKTNLKFGKVMNSLIQRYGKQMTETQLLKMKQVVNNHGSFLKKKMLSSIEKIAK